MLLDNDFSARYVFIVCTLCVYCQTADCAHVRFITFAHVDVALFTFTVHLYVSGLVTAVRCPLAQCLRYV